MAGLEIAWLIVEDKILTVVDALFLVLLLFVMEFRHVGCRGRVLDGHSKFNKRCDRYAKLLSVALNAVPGVEFQFIEKRTYATRFALEEEANRQARAKDLDFLAEEYAGSNNKNERKRYPQNNKN